ncbi:MAG: DNA polymerase III subunit delta [Gammaproteobacteria bacterium]
MRLKADQLEAALKKGLSPVYLIAGDEPLQQGEAADAIRAAAKQAGFSSREIFTVDAHFEWAELNAAADSLAIFADKKILDLRLPSGKPGAEGSKALQAYCERVPEDTLLLVTAGKLESASLKSKWFQALEREGVVVQVWPLAGQELIRWLQTRMQQRGMTADSDGLRILASRVEGNLLAAAQEIEKLYVLYGPSRLSHEAIESVVADSSRYDVFNLCDCVLAGKTGRVVKVLQGLKTEGVLAPVVLWAIAREARLLSRIKTALAQGQQKDLVYKKNQVWEKRKPLVNGAVSRLNLHRLNKIMLMNAQADRQIKGQEQGDPWETLLSVCLAMAGADVMAEAS